MKLRHKKPCKECPWRKCAPAGYMGGYDPATYADAVDNNEVPACHLKDDFGPDDDRTSMCVGALTTMIKQCKSAYNTKGGEEARKKIADTDLGDCFDHVRLFYEHHAGKPYVPFLFRK